MNGTANGTFNIALMTSGGLAPCLSSSVASLITYWKNALADGKISGLSIRCYRDGYKGILIGDSFLVGDDISVEEVERLHELGGSPIGNSRVKVRESFSCNCFGFGLGDCLVFALWSECERGRVWDFTLVVCVGEV